MADRLGQVTIPAGGKVQLQTGLPSTVYVNQYVQFLTVQNNGGNEMRFGDETVSATRGIKLTASGASSQSSPFIYSTMISDWWVQGTPGDVLDFLFIP